MLLNRCLVVCLLVFGLVSAAAAQKPSTHDKEVRAAMANFIKVFTHLEWQSFLDSFADDATVFFPPSTQTTNRATGKTELAAVFKNVFEGFRKRRTEPPYFSVEPRDMHVQTYGSVAIVTFHVDESSRRTLVFRKVGKRWLVVHLHGSMGPVPARS